METKCRLQEVLISYKEVTKMLFKNMILDKTIDRPWELNSLVKLTVFVVISQKIEKGLWSEIIQVDLNALIYMT